MLALAVVSLIAWVVILVTGKYPAGMANFALGAMRWGNRVVGYYLLLTDQYPPFSLDAMAAYPVRFDGTVQIDGRNRVTCFFRYIMAIPHLIILGVLGYAVGVTVFIGWLVALFTGSLPAGLHTFHTGYARWQARSQAYLMLLTDEYPPFAMS
jgi:hypothetical protein